METKQRGTQEAQQLICRRGAAALRKGLSRTQAAEACGVSSTAAHRWQKRPKEAGHRALASRTRGREHGEPRRLSATQEAPLRRWISDRTPEQLPLPFLLWERRAVQALAQKRCQLHLPVRPVGEYSRRWGWSCQRPATRFEAQRLRAVQRWLQERYPAIVARAREQGARSNGRMRPMCAPAVARGREAMRARGSSA